MVRGDSAHVTDIFHGYNGKICTVMSVSNDHYETLFADGHREILHISSLTPMVDWD